MFGLLGVIALKSSAFVTQLAKTHLRHHHVLGGTMRLNAAVIAFSSLALTAVGVSATSAPVAAASHRTCHGQRATIVGHGTVRGTSHKDVIFLTGPSVVTAGGGNDLICGSAGRDVINAGTGNDRVFGNGGNDAVVGGAGIDRINGGAGKDTINGGPGNDVESGDVGDDDLSGDDGADTLNGGIGDDVIDGGAGVDRITGGNGNDVLDGGAGADNIDGGDGLDSFESDGSDVFADSPDDPDFMDGASDS
jgi:hypothetical protein